MSDLHDALRCRAGSANRGADLTTPSFPAGTRKEELVEFFEEVDVESRTISERSVCARRGSVLGEAMKVINGERQDVYGAPERSFERIANYWTEYLGDQMSDRITPQDVAMMMTLFKIAREANQHKRDNIVDAAGYLGIYADMQGEG